MEASNNAKLREAALAIRADILKRRSENCWYATDSDILKKIDAALAEPSRVCDRPDADADYFYRMFAAYVQRKNPAHREPSPLMTCFDAIKFLLMSESEAAK